jgi:GTP-binding protein EngB required for normal cell division
MCRFVQLGPNQIRGHDGKGHAISYTLLPIHLLRQLLSGTVPVPNSILGFRPILQIGPFMDLFDEFNDSKEKLDAYRLFLQGKKQYVTRDHIDRLNDTITSLDIAHKNMKAGFSRAVADIRDGTSGGHCLQELHVSFPRIPLFTIIVDEQSDKINFIDASVSSGATYIGFNGLSLNSVTRPHSGPPPYAFRFNNYVVKFSRSWEDQRASLMEFLWLPDRRSQVYLVDFDAYPDYGHLDSARFFQMNKRTAEMAQPAEPRKSSTPVKSVSSKEAAPCPTRKCIAQYDENALQTSNTAWPTERQLVKIPCPGRYCDSRLDCAWTCAICDTPIEFAFTQDYIYCDCGRAFYKKWRFKCIDKNHGQSSVRYCSRDLRRFLTRMDPVIYRNILVLGETGVGKSTFINAFHNYVRFESFDKAKEASKAYLEFAVPCSFSFNRLDPSNPYGDFKSVKIQVGPQDDDTERDGSNGGSATQKTSVYPMRYRNTTYRLIDTPGIGDTRGPEQDKINMRGILDALSKYQEVHGILILLKTDQSRLTATFRFCFEELLSHIHRSAVTNVAFGFTHARNSDYLPGQSLGPLHRLLTKHTDVNFTLNPSTAYCFDAESFRYLAAYHQGVNAGGDRVYRESWDNS